MDAFTAKWTDSGILQWFMHYAASDSDKTLEPLSIGRDNAGKLYITGYYTGTVTLGTFTLPDNGPINFFYARLNADGDVELAGGNQGISTLNSGHCIRADGQGNVYILGSDLAYKTYLSHESTIMSLNSSGGLRWANQENAGFYEMELSQNYLYYSGTITGEGNIGQFFFDPPGASDAFLACSDLGGNYDWAKMPGHISPMAMSRGYGISLDGQGQLYQCGYFRTDIVLDDIELVGGSQGFVLDAGSSGDYQWANTLFTSEILDICASGYLVAVSWLDYLVAYESFSGEHLYTETIGHSPDQIRFSGTNSRIILTGDHEEFAFVSSYSDMSNPEWSYQFGGDSGTGYCLGTDTDSDGNIYCFNYASNPMAYYGAEVGRGMFLTRQDASGNIAWIKEFENIHQGAGPGRYIVVDTVSGSVYISGTFDIPFDIPGITTLFPSENGSFYIIGYDLEGEYRWHVQGDGLFDFNCLALDHSGNVLLSGVYNGSATVGIQQLASYGGSDAFIARYTSGGQFLWALGAGGESEEYIGLISVDSQDNICFAGEFTSENVTFHNLSITLNEGDGNLLLAKLDPDGQALWLKAKGGSPMLYGDYRVWPTGVLTDAQGYSYVKGWHGDSTYFDNFLKTNPYSSKKYLNYFIARFDPSGNTVWVNSIHESQQGFDYNMMDADSEGNVYIGAQVRDTVWFEDDYEYHCEGYPDTRDLFIGKYTPGGALDWVKTIPSITASGIGANVINCLTACAEDEILMGGAFYYDIQLPPFDLTSDCKHGMLAFLAEPTSLTEGPAARTPFFTVTPNPTGDIMWITLSSPATGQIRFHLIDISGRTVLTTFIPPNERQIMLEVSSLHAGIYFLEARDEYREQAIKVVIE